MKSEFYLISLFIFITLFHTLNLSFVNSKKTQTEYKRNKKFKRQHIKIEENKAKKNMTKKIKRKLDNDDEDDEELTDSVYNRCDNGHTPDDLSDCTKNETPESSCCLFKYGQDTGCVLIGFKYLGTKSVGDMVVNCESNNIGIYNFLLLIMIIFLF